MVPPLAADWLRDDSALAASKLAGKTARDQISVCTLLAMGVDREAVSALLLARATGASFERTLMLGRQRMHIQPTDLTAAFTGLRLQLTRETAEALVAEAEGFAEPLLRVLGARDAHSLDNSGFEGSTLVHDLNEPVPEDWTRDGYSLVWDGGTLEHVFNFPVAARNAMAMTRVGGHYLGMTPANNWMGHGFYQFSPELLYRVFARENGFRVVWMLLKASRHPASRWYSVRDPEEVGERVTMTARNRGTLYVLAERVEDCPIFKHTPQQSDYAEAWSTGTVDRERGADRLKTHVRRALNERLSSRLTDGLFTASLWLLPTHDSRFFEAVDLDEKARSGPDWAALQRSVESVA